MGSWGKLHLPKAALFREDRVLFAPLLTKGEFRHDSTVRGIRKQGSRSTTSDSKRVHGLTSLRRQEKNTTLKTTETLSWRGEGQSYVTWVDLSRPVCSGGSQKHKMFPPGCLPSESRKFSAEAAS